MTVLQVGSLAFGYGSERLFHDLSFTIAAGDRLAIVAPNGAGKSTLLRLVVGELAPVEGTVVVRRGARVGYYRQSHEHREEGTVLDAFLSGFGDILEARTRLETAQREAASGEARALDRLAHAMEEYRLSGGDDLERRIRMVMEHLGFAESVLSREVKGLSGGERGRLQLGVVLAQQPELLLLDEPTNHLDLDTIRWLGGFLQSFPGAVMIVSHDRVFLESATTATLELGQQRCRLYPFSFTEYEMAREAELKREAELAERQDAFIAKTEDFIRRNLAGQQTNQAKSRRKMLAKLDRLDRPEDIWKQAEDLSFRFSAVPRSGDIALEAQGLSATRGGKELFRGVELRLRRGERLAIVGPNGSGKTTLLQILAGRPTEGDQGMVKLGSNLFPGYFDQKLGSLDESKTAVEEIRSVKGELNVEAARTYLGQFQIRGDDTLRPIRGMSGGERSRLALAKLLLLPLNLLFLDEPTNHLDMVATDILEEALTSYEGTLIFVSHDQRFLENVATRVLAFEQGEVSQFQGTFGEWGELRARERSQREGAVGPARVSEPPKAGRLAYEEERQLARAKERRERRFREVESRIAAVEDVLRAHSARVQLEGSSDWETLAKEAEREKELQGELESLMGEWAELGEELEGARS